MQIPIKYRKYLPGYHPRYGTPLAPGKLGEPWWWVPRSNADAWRLLKSLRFLKRVGAVVGAVVILSLVWGLLHLPAATPPIGPINTVPSVFGPIAFRSPIGWTVAGGGGDLTTQPLVLFAPQADPARAPATISFLVVDVTQNVTALTADPSASLGTNPRTFLSAVIDSYLPSAGRGSYCTTDLTYGASDSGAVVVPVATQITWLETRPLGYLVIPGPSKNLGPCTAGSVPQIVHGPFPTATVAPPTSAPSGAASAAAASASASPSAASSASGSAPAEATPMVAIQWFALPAGGVFRSENTQKMLVVSLMYPANLVSADITSLTTIFDTVVGSIAPAL